MRCLYQSFSLYPSLTHTHTIECAPTTHNSNISSHSPPPPTLSLFAQNKRGTRKCLPPLPPFLNHTHAQNIWKQNLACLPIDLPNSETGRKPRPSIQHTHFSTHFKPTTYLSHILISRFALNPVTPVLSLLSTHRHNISLPHPRSNYWPVDSRHRQV